MSTSLTIFSSLVSTTVFASFLLHLCAPSSSHASTDPRIDKQSDDVKAVPKDATDYERFLVGYTVVWGLAFAIVVATGVYEEWDELVYFVFCFVPSLPIFFYPYEISFSPSSSSLLFPSIEVRIRNHHAHIGNAWLALFAAVGNFGFTHYFYGVLGAKYTFPSWRFNDVPICLFFPSFYFFCTYHALSNIILRRFSFPLPPIDRSDPTSRTNTLYRIARLFHKTCLILTLSYGTAWMETFSIQKFPYYSFQDRQFMETWGSCVYGLYFVASFPAFEMVGDERALEWLLRTRHDVGGMSPERSDVGPNGKSSLGNATVSLANDASSSHEEPS
ncbi:Bifunctional protein GlmU, partial [Gonapodya sp. JEL0774]